MVSYPVFVSHYGNKHEHCMGSVLTLYFSYLHGVMDGEIVEDMVQKTRGTTRLTIV